MASKSFEDLEVWRRAHDLVLAVYRLTTCFPRDETFGLTSQLRRAAVSVPANIAEGFARHTLQERARFYNIAQASLAECRYHLMLARDLGYADTSGAMRDEELVGRLLAAYRQAMLAGKRDASS